MYLLFYSKKCKYSNKFIDLLIDIKEDRYFETVEVVKINGKFNPLIKKYNIKEVPTIIVDSQMYVGQSAFKWLSNKIKNINHQVSTMDTRANKIPVISGYSLDVSGSSIGECEDFQGNGLFSPIGKPQKIDTPDAELEYEKTPFILPDDNITNGQINQDTRPDKTSRIDNDLEKLLEQRKLDLPSRRF
jgi:hypothetical protein